MNIVVVGAQWGDEGKGKIVDFLSEKAELVVRFSGGANAGHTIIHGDKVYKLHLVPSGIVSQGKISVLGAGMVVDPVALFHELDGLAEAGVKWEGRVFVSDRAHLVLSTYKELDQQMESQRRIPIGTTGRGIGVTYALKAHRDGVRVGDLYSDQIWSHLRPAEKEFLAPFRDRLLPLVVDQAAFMRKNKGRPTLFEGAQGVLLDLDWGTYPFVSSGYSASGGAALGGGIGPRSIDRVYGVFKAYTTRVGNGPFPTEFRNDRDGELGEQIRSIGKEYGVTTGRARRTGFLDLVALRYACWTNSLDGLVITKMDIYDGFDTIKVCTGYKIDGELTIDFPTTIEALDKVVPVIQEFPGWKTDLTLMRKFDDLPKAACDYLHFIEKFVETPISVISVGPDKAQTFQRDGSVDTILILDFGGQTCQLIGRRLREAGFYSEIAPHNTLLDSDRLDGVKGIILSGSPYSVYEEDAPSVDPRLLETGLPILGICYGFQLVTHLSGGRVESLTVKEYGRVALTLKPGNPLFEGVPSGFNSWMSHGDSIATLAPGFDVTAVSDNHPAAAWNFHKKIWGIQFHPETSHNEFGNLILENFAKICGASKDWTLDKVMDLESRKIRERVGKRDVLLLISGGVDSTVAGAMLLKILGPEQVHLMYIDTGLMRKNESEEVAGILRQLGAKHLHLVQAESLFLLALKGISDPESKRKAIGDTFIRVQEEEVSRLTLSDYFLAQGTLYTDLIESGKGVGKKAHVIKSHHNVGTPLVEAKRAAGLIVEPLAMLYKDEVRALGEKLGVGESIVWRHPFPGPGLGIRVLGEVTREKCDILREADWIYVSELKSRGLYKEIWQAFSVLLPVRSVGVTGDTRDYGFVLALRAVVSKDGMSADVYQFPMKHLLEISSLITNQVRAIGRVTYDISSKPPSTIEWE